MPTTIRLAEPSDVIRLVAMNKPAYPELVEDGVVFDEAQIRAQQAVFAEGQIVAEKDGVVVGAIATLIVPSTFALAPHTWTEATSFGTFACHDPKGDALYLADVYSDPAAKGSGVGAALHNALFRLCQRRRLARVVAGGRLFGYHEVEDVTSPEAYADQVLTGKRKDRVFSSQLQAGFVYRGILPGYLDDWRSGGFATLLSWENPAYRPSRLAENQQAETTVSMTIGRRDRLS